MRIRLAFALLLATLAPLANAQVNALPPTRHILVYGDAQARAVPDRFKVKLNFSSVDRDAGAARARVEKNIRDILGRLRAAGVDEREIVATSMSIEPKQHYDDDRNEQVFDGTEVERSLTARFEHKEAVEAFLGRLQTSRELTVSGVETELSDENALRTALREKAIADSREKAGTIARAYGARLGALYSVSDVAPQFQYGIQEGRWRSSYEWSGDELGRVEVTGSRMGSAPNAVALQTGYVTFTDKIYAVFLLAD